MALVSLGTKMSEIEGEDEEFFPSIHLDSDQMKVIGDMKIGDERETTVVIRLASLSESLTGGKNGRIDVRKIDDGGKLDQASILFPKQGE